MVHILQDTQRGHTTEQYLMNSDKPMKKEKKILQMFTGCSKINTHYFVMLVQAGSAILP